MAEKILRFPALEIRQGSNRVLYSFAADGKDVYSFATVSRIRRENQGEVCGYQRPEVLSHIAEIRKYLECSDPMIPNAFSMPCCCSTFTKASSVVIFMGRIPWPRPRRWYP